jgi:hypothetical protein
VTAAADRSRPVARLAERFERGLTSEASKDQHYLLDAAHTQRKG